MPKCPLCSSEGEWSDEEARPAVLSVHGSLEDPAQWLAWTRAVVAWFEKEGR